MLTTFIERFDQPFENMSIRILFLTCVLTLCREIGLYYQSFESKNKFQMSPSIEDYLTHSCAPKLRKCAELLKEIKNQLPPEIANKLAKMITLKSHHEHGQNMLVTPINIKNTKYLIAIGEDLLSVLNDSEIRAFLGHEVSHIILNHFNITRQMCETLQIAAFISLILSSTVMVILSSLQIVYLLLTTLEYLNINERQMRYLKTDKIFNTSKELPHVVMLLLISLIIARLAAMYFQHQELGADTKSINLGSNPQDLISGLKKVEILQPTKTLHITKKSIFKYVQHLFSTHPDIPTRAQNVTKSEHTSTITPRTKV